MSNMYVSEQKLKFYVNAMKYQKYLKELQKNPEEFKKNFQKSISKKIKLLESKRTEENSKFVDKNINYYKSLKIESVEDILKNFDAEKEKYLDFLLGKAEKYQNEKNKKLQKRKIKKRSILLQEAKEIEKLNVDSQKIRENFGELLILIINKILKMPKFAGYTNAWKEDFYINAVEKSLQYVYNFDNNIVSLKTGNPSTAFNYLTQIIMNAIIAVINKEKKNSDFLKKEVENKSLNNPGVMYIRNNILDSYEEEESKLEIIIKDKNAIDDYNEIEVDEKYNVLEIKVPFTFDMDFFNKVKSKINRDDVQVRISKIRENQENETN